MRPLLLAAALAVPAPTLARDFDGADWAWSLLAGTGAAAAVGFAGGLAAAVALQDDPEDFTGLVAAVFVGMPLGADLGATGAVYTYGELSDHQGSLGATLAGGTIGAIVGLGLFLTSLRVDSKLLPLGLVFMAATPAAGATAGYVLSLDAPEVEDQASVGSLLGWHPEAGLTLGVPRLETAADRAGRFAVGLSLVGGRF
ncbi:MAG: hypothetical protein R3F60_12505 [bacterium]